MTQVGFVFIAIHSFLHTALHCSSFPYTNIGLIQLKLTWTYRSLSCCYMPKGKERNQLFFQYYALHWQRVYKTDSNQQFQKLFLALTLRNVLWICQTWLHQLKQNDHVIISNHSCWLWLCPCLSFSAVCCISMWAWTASALLWAHKENCPAAAGAGGGRLVCVVPPQITLRWPLSMADR